MKYRIFIDDFGASNTQAAVLSCFVSSQISFKNADIIKSSKKADFHKWNGVNDSVARRLNFILEALSYAPNTVSVYFPTHMIPSEPFLFEKFDEAISSKNFSVIIKLDLFMVNNGHADIQRFNTFCAQNKNYSQISNYSDFVVNTNAQWIYQAGICSAYAQTQRPWYRAGALMQDQWMGWVARAAKEGFLKQQDMKDDIEKQSMRPSMRLHLDKIFNNIPHQSDVNYMPDRYYTFPENRLSHEQFQLLHSKGMQKRLLKYYQKKHNTNYIIRRLLKIFTLRRIFKRL